MMPDLGKYTYVVLGSYAVTFALIAGLVLFSLWQSRRMKRALNQAVGRRDV